MKQNLQTSFNVIKSIKAVAEKLENSKLDTATLMAVESDFNDLSPYLEVEQNKVMIFCVVFFLEFLGDDVRLIDIVNYIDLNADQTESVQAVLNSLVEYKLIFTKPNLVHNQGNEMPNTKFVINPKITDAILNNSIILSYNLDYPMNIFQFTETIRELVDFKNYGLLNNIQLLNAIEKLELINENLNAIRELNEYEVELIDRVVLYYMFAILICWNTGCSLNKSINPVFNALGKNYNESLAIIEDNSDLIKNGFISTRKSFIMDDYYLELKADVLILFLVETSNVNPPINQLFTEGIIRHNENYFNNN